MPSLFLCRLFQLAVLPLALAIPPDTTQYNTRGSGINWKSCDLGLNETAPMQCGNLNVPLDYTDPHSKTKLELDLLRVKATKKPSKGSIILNFGGPGISGKADFAFYARQILGATGGYHDLVTFVPRGTDQTIRFSCYGTDEERSYASVLNPVIAGNSSDTAVGRIWAESRIFDATCGAVQNETGRFVGTAFVARDVMQIVDALDEDGMLRYWGVSYGTVLGETTAAMFPKRIDKMVLDGVVNPYEYYANREAELFTDTDKVLSGFCKGCVANPTNCALAGDKVTASELEASIYAFLDNLKFNPIIIPLPAPLYGYVVDYTTVKTLIFSSLYAPQVWHILAYRLKAIMTVDAEAIIAIATELLSGPPVLDAESMFGIKCSDASDPTANLADILPTIESRHRNSRIGGDTADHVVARCAGWKLPAKERYSGDFHVKTKNPLLVIGNTYDPVTPLASARNVSESFENAVLLQHDGYGHDSHPQASFCTAKAIRAYFVKGKLPKKGTKCAVDTTLFDGSDGWDKVLEKLDKDNHY
ncbi:TAP-like protein-domain-containing protein [Thelonectria olida]|uniref:TAP-like protein-domain-containing protein n=1 Tax=Thelonectria olida TaxID=1576542 RepID=A0A9P8VYM8_9HYPO|nr:TAP-like protein-domain-containing protein [Thelonectria olida]